MPGLDSLFETYKTAALQKDVDLFISIFDEDVLVFDMWAWAFEGIDAWRDMAKGWFSSVGKEQIVVSFEDIRIQATEEMGTATAIARFAGVDENGKELRSLLNRITWIARKKNGQWKVFHEHTSGPADMATLKVQLNR